FITGVPIGIMVAIGYLIVAYFISLREGHVIEDQKFSIKYIYKTFIKAIPALMVPVVILGGIMSGIVTPTESAALAVLCGIIAGIIYKELTIKKLIEALEDGVRNTAVVMFIVATGTILGFAFSALGVGKQMMEPFLAFGDNT